jgi:hypothetical protein
MTNRVSVLITSAAKFNWKCKAAGDVENVVFLRGGDQINYNMKTQNYTVSRIDGVKKEPYYAKAKGMEFFRDPYNLVKTS